MTEPAPPGVPQAAPESAPPSAVAAAEPGAAAEPAEAAAPGGGPGRAEVDRACRRLVERAGGPQPRKWLVVEAEDEAVVPLRGHSEPHPRGQLEKAGRALSKPLRERARALGASGGLATRHAFAARVRPAEEGKPEALLVSVRAGLVAPLPPGAALGHGAAGVEGRPAGGATANVRWRVLDAADAAGLAGDVARLLAGEVPEGQLPVYEAMVYRWATTGRHGHARCVDWARREAAASDAA